MMTFQEKLDKIVRKNKSLVCVGLDSDVEKIPRLPFDSLRSLRVARDDPAERGQFSFNKKIIQATADLVCSYKLNTAFYEAIGLKGILQLKFTTNYLKKNFPQIPIIIDAKRGDIGNTNQGYVQFIFNFLNADAVTVNPYLGEEAIRPFLEAKDKGIIILCRTSNPGAGEFQDLMISHLERSERSRPKAVNRASLDFSPAKRVRNDMKLYQYVAYQVVHKWNKNKNCLLVVGATYPDELREVRKIVGEEMFLLVPGIGAQGGDLQASLKAGLNKKKTGLIINSSRGIIFAKNPRAEALNLKNLINEIRNI